MLPHETQAKQSYGRNHWTLEFQGGYLAIAVEGFLTDRRASNKAAGTIESYKFHLTHFVNYCTSQELKFIQELSAGFIRQYLISLALIHNPGGVHAKFRAVRAFLYWIEEEEVMPAGWKNPIHKVRAPTVPENLLEPIPLEDVNRLLDACKGESANRDKSIFLFLLDTGVRARELCNINLDDVEMGSGAITIRQGKGRKPRTVYIGRKTRRALRAYLRTRRDNSPALFVTTFEDRLTYSGLREILRRRSLDAGIKKTTLHRFRHAFAINYLRNGGDIFTLQRLMGHTTLDVLKKYLKLIDQDTQIAHARFSPADRLRE
jgi:site-specific recombinase XerD